MKKSILKALLTTLVLAELTIVQASMIEADVLPHKGNRDTDIIINYEISSTTLINPRIKVYLSNYIPETNAFNTSTSLVLIDYFNIELGNLSPINLKLNNTISGFYRICLGLRADGVSSTYTDCDSGNQFLLIDETPIIMPVKPPQHKVLLIANPPAKAYSGEQFIINVTLINTGTSNSTVTVYSYAEGVASKPIIVSLSPDASSIIQLTQTINSTGKQQLMVIADYGQRVEVTGSIIIEEQLVRNVFLEEPVMINDSLRLTVTNLGTINETITIKLYGAETVLSWNKTVFPLKSADYMINQSQVDGLMRIFLYNNNFLIQEKIFLIKTLKQNNSVSSLTNEQNLNAVTGMQLIVNDSGMENLLYLIMVLLSITSLVLVIKKI
ncbi:MAG: CARDB domain-containing protein [Candidatus Nanoarchaeia archaeon]